MEKATKKSTLKPKLQKAKTKAVSVVRGNPGKHLKIIIVTGSTGKHAVASFIQKILVAHKIPTALITSPANQPVTTFALYKYLSKSLRSGATHVVVEAPAPVIKKHTFHQLPIHMAVLTNTADSDITGQSSIFQASPHYIVLNRDDPNFDKFADFSAQTTSATYGQHKDAHTRINRSKLYKKGTEATLTANSTTFDVATFVVGESAPSFMAAAATVATLLDIPQDIITEGIADYEPSES